jgi:hypothetical protein
MFKYLTPISLLALAIAIGATSVQSASAAKERQAFCYPIESILETDRTKPNTAKGAVQYAATATVFFNKQLNDEGRNRFMKLTSSNGHNLICAW